MYNSQKSNNLLYPKKLQPLAFKRCTKKYNQVTSKPAKKVLIDALKRLNVGEALIVKGSGFQIKQMMNAINSDDYMLQSNL